MKQYISPLLISFIIALACCSGPESLNDKFLQAAEDGNLDSLKMYLKQGADINYRSQGFLALEETACMKAAKKGHLKVLKYLIKKGADFHKGSSGNENPITLAAEHGFQDIVLFLVKKGEDINYQETNYGMNALLHACRNSDAKYVEKLIKLGASFDVRDKRGDTPLILACISHNFDVVSFLLSKGVDPNLKGFNGRPAIIPASTTVNHPMTFEIPDEVKKTVDALLEAGADVNLQDGDGNTALIFAAQKKRWAMVDYLLKNGADKSIKNNAGVSFYDVRR